MASVDVGAQSDRRGWLFLSNALAAQGRPGRDGVDEFGVLQRIHSFFLPNERTFLSCLRISPNALASG